MIVRNNRGYISADENFDEKLSIDFIPLDSSHSPIKKVNYRVEPARVGKRIDYENLTLEIWTTGAIPPIEALAQAAKIMRDHMIIFMNIVDEPMEKEPIPTKREIPYMSQIDILSKPIEHLELSVRSNNCLRSAGIEKIYELVQKTEEELLKTKNFGRKSLSEIKETLTNLGLGLSLDLHPKLVERIKGDLKHRPGGEGVGGMRHLVKGRKLRRTTAHRRSPAPESRHVLHRERADPDDPGQGQGSPAHGREDDHPGQEEHPPRPASGAAAS